MICRELAQIGFAGADVRQALYFIYFLVADMTNECRARGTFSARPYVPGQPADFSTQECVLALYHSYCLANTIDPTAMLSRAYPMFETPEKWTTEAWRSLRQAADWQGTTIPETWLEEHEYNLMRSLYSQGLGALGETLMDENSVRSFLAGQGEPS